MTWTPWIIVLAIGCTSHAPVRTPPPPCQPIAVRVVDEAGRPVAGARVHTVATYRQFGPSGLPEASYLETAESPVVTTDATGTAAVCRVAPDRTGSIVVEHLDWPAAQVPAHMREVTIGPARTAVVEACPQAKITAYTEPVPTEAIIATERPAGWFTLAKLGPRRYWVRSDGCGETRVRVLDGRQVPAKLTMDRNEAVVERPDFAGGTATLTSLGQTATLSPEGNATLELPGAVGITYCLKLEKDERCTVTYARAGEVARPGMYLDRAPTRDCPVCPEPRSESERVRDHLAGALELLRARDVSELSPEIRTKRAAAIENLVRYIARGEFPRRTDDPHGELQPRFIDDRGVHCAVGQLVADSGHPELARSIADRFEYAFVRDIDEPELIAWAAAHGFTLDELARIQPSYGFEWTPDRPRRDIEQHAPRIALECGRSHAVPASLEIRVRDARDGSVDVSSKSTEPFATCFVLAARAVARGDRDSSRGESYDYTMQLPFTQPQELFEQRLARWTPEPYCTPRPGPLARSASIAVAATSEGLDVQVTTKPVNERVRRCLEQHVTQLFHDFGAGAWDLRTSRTVKLSPRMASITSTVKNAARGKAPDCLPNPEPGAVATIEVRANPDDAAFAVTSDGPEAFAVCMRDYLTAFLKNHYTFQRELENGTFAPYFRIDAAVNAKVTIELESKAARDARMKKLREQAEATRERLKRKRYEID